MRAGLSQAGLLLALLLTLLFGAAAGKAVAAEMIESYRSDIDLSRDGTVTVTEVITVNAEGREIRRGIFRDFPLFLQDANGRLQRVGFEVLSVARDGAPEEWHTETIEGGLRIFMGSSERLLSPGRHTYELTYRTDRQVRYFPDHEEFYWNVTGTGWIFPINRASAVVSLPPGVSATDTTVYTGRQGSREKNARIGGSATAPRFETTRPLRQQEGLTIVIAVPKGSIAAPSRAQQRDWFLRDNLNLIIGFGGLAIVTLYYVWCWRRVGRDPPKGVVVPRWDAPDGLSPALVNYVHNRGFSGAGWEALSASFIELAVKGHVTLEDLDSRIVVRRTDRPLTETLPAGQAVLMRDLGGPGSTFVIDRDNGERVQTVARNFRSAIEKEHRGRYYRRNLGPMIGGALVSLLVLGVLLVFGNVHPDSVVALAVPAVGGMIWGRAAVSAARAFMRRRTLFLRLMAAIGFAIVGFIALSAAGFFAVSILDSIDNGEWPVFVSVGGLFLVNGLFFVLMGAPTPLGARLMAGIAGLELYLTLAERDRLNMAGAPKMSPQHFETLLPYAVALGVERPWSDTFNRWLATAAAGAAAYQPVWYHGGSIGDFGSGIGAFSSSMASSIASTIPQTSSSSSSGFSGGSSGGGGGGGGGGGW
ncbi:Predicted membrane protein [Rhizobium sp. RU35A]|nr:Predicted membrane protein [Rhizobium sp. RU35A]